MAGQGQIYTFSDTVTPKRTVADYIRIIDPQEIPLISYFGLNNVAKFKLINFPNHEYAWLDDTLRIRTATLDESGFDTTETDLTVASGHGIRFHVGDVWEFDETGELIYVAAHDGTDTVTTIIRNWDAAIGGTQGTAASGVTNGTTLSYRYNARMEGAESTASMWTVPTETKNNSQIFHAEIKVSGSEQDASTRYGIRDQYKFQLQKWIGGAGAGAGQFGNAGDLMMDLEATFAYGRKVARSASLAGATGGMFEFLTSSTSNVTDLNGTDLTEEVLLEAIGAAWDGGGKPRTIIVGRHNKKLINQMYRESIRTERSERTGGVVINQVETDFGILDVMLARKTSWPADTVGIFQRDLVGWVTHRKFHVHPLSVGGDYKKDEILGEYGLVFQSAKAHALIIDTSVPT